MQKFILMLCFLFACCKGKAQQPKTAPVTFQSMLQAGLLEGEKGSAFQLHILGGLRWRTWSAGLGTGLDYYGIRSVPVFFDLRKALLKKPAAPFLYGSIGKHFAWPKEQEMNWQEVNASGGLLYEVGLGYQWPARKSAFYFSAGYSYKSYREEMKYTICPFVPPCFETVSSSAYSLRRLSIRAGFRF